MARASSIESVGDRYRLEREIGRGPVGTVFAGVDRESGQQVCVKLLDRRHTQDPRFAVRFREGQRQIAPVVHENLAGVIDYGCQDGRYYIVTEWVEAEDLGSYLAAHGPLPHPEAVAIGQQICAGLAAAHQGGVLHRGLKPQNVLIAGDGDVKVADLGLAGVVGETGLSKTKVLASGASYMAPEQARGQEYGPESDIYSVGVLLFEMLTGRRPFDGRNAWSLLRRQVEDIPHQPSQLNPQVPLDLGAVVMIALRKDRAARYSRAEQLAEALEGNGLEHEPAVAAPERPAGVGLRKRIALWLSWAAWRVRWAVQAGLIGIRVGGLWRAISTGGRRLREAIPLGVLVALLFLLGFGITFGALSMIVDAGDTERLTEEAAAPAVTASAVQSATPTTSPTKESSDLQSALIQEVEIESRGPGERVKFRGEVQAINGEIWTIGGRQVIVNSDTKLKGEIGLGDPVNVNARQLPNGMLLAEEVERHR